MKEPIESHKDFYPGTWVRFYRNGKLIIGQVEYLYKELGKVELLTDKGAVSADYVIEYRNK